MELLLILAALIGIYQGYDAIRKTRLGIYDGVKPSKNIFTFLFTDRY